MMSLYKLVLIPEAPQIVFLVHAEARSVLRSKRQAPQVDMGWSKQSVQFPQSKNAAGKNWLSSGLS
jgi:hypothetical protein